MTISLQKGQRIDLTKGKSDLNRIMVGLGWDPAGKTGGFGFFKSAPNVDCDASVLMLQNDRFTDKKDLVYFGHKSSDDGSVVHSGDNLTGDGDGDDEVIMIDLKNVPSQYNKLVFVVNIYDSERRKQDFGMIKNAYIRVVNPQTNEEIIRYNLSDNYSGQTTLITGEIYRHENEWKFAAVGTGTTDANLSSICNRYV